MKSSVKKDYNVDKKVLGIPVFYSDEINKSIQFVRNLKNCDTSSKILGKDKMKYQEKVDKTFLKMDMEIDFNQ